MPKAKVLFVDDEPRIVRLLSMLFRHEYDVLTATSGAEAIEIIKENKLHVIVSDQRMPQMTGIQFLSEARRLSPNTSRILLTGYSDLVAIIGAVNDGEVFRFLNKPWKEDELIATVGEAAILAEQCYTLERDGSNEHHVSSLSSATKLLAIDGVGQVRHELVEMFTDDYHVLSARSIPEAMQELHQHNVAVVVAVFDNASDDAVNLCAEMRKQYPNTTIVLTANTTDSELIVRLINEGNIYRFAMRPIAPNVFRLAVGAAIKEHQRRIARSRTLEAMECSADADGNIVCQNANLASQIRTSLEKFTETW